MTRYPSPLDLWITGYQIWATTIEAQAVVAMRMMGMANLWNVTPYENTRMIIEKPQAFGRAAMVAGLAMSTGKQPHEIVKSATSTIRKKTRSNARRLAKRGPKIGA